MSKYFVYDFKQVKNKSSFDKTQSHVLRTGWIGSNVNKERSNNNIVLNSSGRNFDELMQYAQGKIKTHNSTAKEKGEKKHRNLKKGSSVACNIVVTHSHEALSKEESIKYLKEVSEALCKRFEGLTNEYSVIHLDETTPHLHLRFSYFSESNSKWSQRDFYDKLNVKNTLEEVMEPIGSKYGLKRGDKGAKPQPQLHPAQVEKLEKEESKKLQKNTAQSIKEHKARAKKIAHNIVKNTSAKDLIFSPAKVENLIYNGLIKMPIQIQNVSKKQRELAAQEVHQKQKEKELEEEKIKLNLQAKEQQKKEKNIEGIERENKAITADAIKIYKENQDLKHTVNLQKKTIKKQNNLIDGLKNKVEELTQKLRDFLRPQEQEKTIKKEEREMQI